MEKIKWFFRKLLKAVVWFFLIAFASCIGVASGIATYQKMLQDGEFDEILTPSERNASIDPLKPEIECDMDFFSGIWFRGYGGNYRVNMVNFPWTLRAEDTFRYLVLNNTTEIDISPNAGSATDTTFPVRYIDLRDPSTVNLSTLSMTVAPSSTFSFIDGYDFMPYACDITFESGNTGMVVIRLTIYEIGTAIGYTDYSVSYDVGIAIYGPTFSTNTFFLPDYGFAVADTHYNYPLYCATVKDYPFDETAKFENTFNDGYKSGYDSGYSTGHDEGVVSGYDSGYSTGYDQGYDVGFSNGSTQVEPGELNGSVKSFVFTLFDAPVSTFLNVFDFQFEGFDFLGIVRLILSLAVIAGIVKLVM